MKEVDFSNWNSSDRNGGSGITFLKFQNGSNIRVRPFGGAVEYNKIFIEYGKPSLTVDIKDGEEAAKLLSEHSGKEFKPSYKCAMFVIDRTDESIKILEGGHQIYDAFGSWTSASGLKPGANAAGDWQISATGDGAGGSNPRKYAPVYLGPVPFTDQEKENLLSLKEQGKLKVGNYLKEIPLDKVIETAFGSSQEAPPAAVDAAGSGDDMDW
jgi:hypothetical protein